MNTKKARILYYDGDGGGFGAHIRHLAHLEYLKLRYNIEIYSAYPTLDVCFKHSYPKPKEIVLEKAILIEDLFKDEKITHDVILNRFAHCAEKDITVLSGRHHGPIPWNKLPRLKWIRRKRLLEYLWKQITPEENGTLPSKRIEKSGLDLRQEFIAVHLRTFVDSEEGYARFLQKKNEQFKIFKQLAISRSQEEKIGNILIASDSRRDAIDLSINLERCGFNCYVDQDDFTSSKYCK